jgi:hypothetical protein
LKLNNEQNVINGKARMPLRAKRIKQNTSTTVNRRYSCHDILSFTQSWLKPNISTDSLKLPGYKPPYRRDRVDRLGAGVVVFVKDEINCATRLDLHVGSVECIWLEIKINNKKYLYGTFYIPVLFPN